MKGRGTEFTKYMWKLQYMNDYILCHYQDRLFNNFTRKHINLTKAYLRSYVLS